LIASLLVLCLCLSSFVGTTFAWFTDSVTSAGNVIKSGNLDIDVQYTLDGENWADLDGANDLFQNGLWEPGHTEVIALKIENKGSLALKYTASMNIVKEAIGKTSDGKDIVLSEILTVGTLVQEANQIGEISVELAFKNENMFKGTAAFKASNVLRENQDLLPGSAHYVIIKVDMAETVGNEANHNGVNIPSIEFGINVFATQYAYENDSFGKDYDKDANFTKVNNTADLSKALDAGEKVLLTDDITLTKTLMAKKDAFIDLNGNTITAPSSGDMFQSQSNAAPSMTITSSVPGAEINVSGGDTAVLLGYGSTEISNVTINVTGCDNYSPNPFKVYGDLTLGEGTVVNVDYLGTALINNNGKVAINIDGAEINIGKFKTNGTAIITLNQASTLEIKNTNIKIDEFVLSPYGGDSLVSKIDGVTIENCTFDVTDSNGASCTFEAKDGKYRLVQK